MPGGLICLDCEDPAGLAAFWAALLGGEVTPVGDDVVVVGNKGTPVAAVRVPGYQPPTWPGGATPKLVHLDLAVGDLDAAKAEAIRLGARRAGEQPHPARWRVMLDPAGHPFCLCDWSQPLPADREDPDHGPSKPVTPPGGRDLDAPADPVQQHIQPGQRVVHPELLADPPIRASVPAPAVTRASPP